MTLVIAAAWMPGSFVDRLAAAVRGMSWDRLSDTLSDWWNAGVGLAASPVGQLVSATGVGIAIGWLLAAAMWNHRWRRGSLVLKAPRMPDTAFGDAATRLADLRRDGDVDRARSDLLRVAATGRIGLWTPLRGGLLRRATGRGLRRDRARFELPYFDSHRLLWSELAVFLPALARVGSPSTAVVDVIATVSPQRGEIERGTSL